MSTIFTISHYVFAINREIEKRNETYPKLLEKKRKSWVEGMQTKDHPDLLEISFRVQISHLHAINSVLVGQYDLTKRATCSYSPEDYFRELQRELRLRKHWYPRWVKWQRMDEETAAYELAVWQHLTEYWHKAYCPNAPWRKPSTRKK